MRLFRALINLYSLKFSRTIVVALRQHDSSLLAYLHWFWNSKTFRVAGSLRSLDKPLVVLLAAATVAQIASGVALIIDWVRFGTVGGWAFGLALLVSYPLVIAHLLPVGMLCRRTMYHIFHPKKLGKAVVALMLESQVRRLRHRHHFVVVAVAGSVGKTSTKLAIAELLGQNLRVRYQPGNYNDRVTVPLVFFNQNPPALLNIFAWMRLFGENTASIEHSYPFDIVVVELGTNAPGQMKQFAYLNPDVTVLTAITPEHMEYFGTLDAVAQEELRVFDYSKQVLVNGDDIAGKYLVGRTFQEYSLTTNVAHNYFAKTSNHSLQGQTLNLEFPSGKIEAKTSFIGEQGAKVALAAAAMADMLGHSALVIKQSLTSIQASAGRMRVLQGIKDSTIIDDTYNASPEPVERGLDVLYATKAKQRIAILGSMNELGEYSREAHREVGAYCDPNKLDMVVTIGADAKRWLAPMAQEAGCQVHSFISPYEAGDFVRKHVKSGAVILAEGSQNGVFAEEAVKKLLAHPSDSDKLVRQSKQWRYKKAKQFSGATL
jgi:UDP-N-acetylmuramoyl-tripeptide--D-alanyl-D-alanine ligase